jgi:threonine/homoserine/homoserine lactone efflux protein
MKQGVKPLRRPGRALGGGNLLGKLAGVVLAVSGLGIIAAKMPSLFWWFLLGGGLIFLGARLFLS